MRTCTAVVCVRVPRLRFRPLPEQSAMRGEGKRTKINQREAMAARLGVVRGTTALHRVVFAGDDADALRAALDADGGALRSHIDDVDARGNAALHIAVMLGRRQCIAVLLEAGASVSMRTAHGAFVLHEARAFGDRDIIRELLKARERQTGDFFRLRSEAITKHLNELDDFSMEMKWEFSSWIPLLSRFCPNDTLKIRKKGSCMRVDTTLIGFEGLRWLRGNVGYVYNPNAKGRELCIVDYANNAFEIVDGQEHNAKKLEERMNMMMNFSLRYGDLVTDNIAINRVRSGILGFGSGKTEKIGDFEADVYTIENLRFKSVIRSEHLDSKLVPKETALTNESSASLPSTTSVDGNPLKEIMDETGNLEDDNPKAREELLKKLDGKKEDDIDNFVTSTRKNAIKYKPSLIPFSGPTVSAETYFSPPKPKDGKSEPEYLHIGRPMSAQYATRKLRATLWMSNSFPLFVEQLFPLMEIMAPTNEHFARLRDFIDLKLPRGFPIKIEIPLFGILTARITFQNYRTESSLEDAIFEVPEGFKEQEIRLFDSE